MLTRLHTLNSMMAPTWMHILSNVYQGVGLIRVAHVHHKLDSFARRWADYLDDSGHDPSPLIICIFLVDIL